MYQKEGAWKAIERLGELACSSFSTLPYISLRLRTRPLPQVHHRIAVFKATAMLSFFLCGRYHRQVAS